MRSLLTKKQRLEDYQRLLAEYDINKGDIFLCITLTTLYLKYRLKMDAKDPEWSANYVRINREDIKGLYPELGKVAPKHYNDYSEGHLIEANVQNAWWDCCHPKRRQAILKMIKMVGGESHG